MADEIKLLRSQRLTDNPDGGGRATATEIVDGEVNNLFDDISRIDRVNGEVSLRKFFAMADTQDTSLFSDLHVIVQEEPLDPRVSVVLFRTPVWDDQRSDAQAYVERYLDESVVTRMVPYDRQLVGQRTVLVYQRPELSLPEIGQVYALKNDATAQREFIRVQDVEHHVETFTDERGDFQVRVIQLTTSQPLTQEFAGSQPNRFFAVEANRSVVRRTIASDAARYKGIVRLARDAPAGSLSVRVESVFAQLVPSSTSEVPVIDARPEGAVVPVRSAVDRYSVSSGSSGGTTFLPTPILPGSVVGRWGANDPGNIDDGKGRLLSPTGAVMGQINYETGVVSGHPNIGTVIEYMPAAFVPKVSQTWASTVTIGNRGYVYAPVLRPLPGPGTTQVSFRALGQWYVLADNGSGELAGEPGTGSGLVNFATGSAPATLGALPDIGSTVIYSFGTTGEFEIRTGDVGVKPPAFRIQVDGDTIEPGSLVLRWQAGSTERTATDNGQGALTGAATGEVVYGSGEILIRPAILPDSNALFEVEYREAASTVEVHTPALVSGSMTIALQGAVRPRTLVLKTVGYGQSKSHRTMRDNGSGGIVDASGATVLGASIVYESGILILPAGVSGRVSMLEREAFAPGLPGRLPNDSEVFGTTNRVVRTAKQFANQVIYVDWINGSAVTVEYADAAASSETATSSYPVGPLRFDLLPLVNNSIVPGGVLFTFAGRTYYDRSGTLYHTMSIGTGAGTAAGTIDYAEGSVAITSWQGGTEPSLAVRSLLSQIATLPMGIVHGRTPGSPLRPGTFTILAVRYADGQEVIATADANGNIATADMHGSIDVNSGSFSVAFGAYVLDSSLSPEAKAESWYNVSDVDADGYIWRPAEVIPGTIRFNCVVQVAVPVDPEIIKINPVRLPMDGRVPVLRRGDTLVIQDSQPYTLPGSLVGGQDVQLPRSPLASLALYDQEGLGVPRAMYQTDLAAGRITMAAPLDLTGYAQPLVAIHIVEDMALCLDAQITGDVQLGQALTHDYVADNGTVSSAQILGDAQARYGYLFTQSTWTNVWNDALIGTPPASGARYNDALFPLVLTNADTITERWRVTFTSPTAYNVIGERLGLIATGTTSLDCSPINPATGRPYFTLRADGFGSGYSTGNTVRWNTYAAGGPLWAARTVLSGPATSTDDRVRIQTRWDKD